MATSMKIFYGMEAVKRQQKMSLPKLSLAKVIRKRMNGLYAYFLYYIMKKLFGRQHHFIFVGYVHLGDEIR